MTLSTGPLYSTASLLTAFDFLIVSGGYSLFTNIYVVKDGSKVTYLGRIRSYIYHTPLPK